MTFSGGEPGPASRAARGPLAVRGEYGVALVVLVLIVAEVIALYAPNTWINRDGRFYVNTNTTLVEHLSLEQHGFASSWYTGRLGWNYNLDQGWSNIALGRNGAYWPKHPYLLPLLSTPLFFAFGLLGTLIFSVLAFGVGGAAGFRFTREHADPASAALAVTGLLLATAVREYAYDYHVDILLLTLFLCGLAAATTGRGATAGVLLAMTVVLKPTSLMFLPGPLALFIERRDRRGVLRAVLGGLAVLGTAAIVNTVMFGRPWWAGYNRTLVVVNGVPQLASHADAFSTPLAEGFKRTMSGNYGLDRRFTLFALAFPGFFAVFRKRPWYGAACAISVAASLFVFSKYNWEGDRFHWPAMALLLPALAASLEWLANGTLALARRLRRRLSVEDAAGPIVAALFAMAAVGATLPNGSPLAARMGHGAYVTGALSLAHGSIDLRRSLGDNAFPADVGAEASILARGRQGQWIPRVSPAAVAIAAPFAAAGGLAGLMFLHLLAAGIASWSLARILGRVAPMAVAASVAAGALLLPPVRDAIPSGGAHVLAAAIGLLALDSALDRRWRAAGALGVVTAWVADAPWLAVIAVLALATLDGRAAVYRAALASAAVLVVWAVVHVVLIGRPFASPDDFVLIRANGAMEVIGVPRPGLRELLPLLTAPNSRLRSLLPIAWLFPFGLAVTALRDRRVAIALGIVALSVFVPGIVASGPPSSVPLLVALVLAAPLAALAAFIAETAGRAFAESSRRQRLIGLAAVLLVLAGIGVIRRIAPAQAAFRIGSERELRRAEVRLGTVPCDFLAWEHMSWECATMDGDAFNQVGMGDPAGLRIGSQIVSTMMLVPSGQRGQARRVTWHDVQIGSTLDLRFAVPDGHIGGAEVRVEIDNTMVDRFEVPPAADGTVHTHAVSTSAHRGRRGTLTLEVRAQNPSRAAIVAFEGGFR